MGVGMAVGHGDSDAAWVPVMRVDQVIMKVLWVEAGVTQLSRRPHVRGEGHGRGGWPTEWPT